MMEKTAITISVNGPVVGAKNMTGFKVREMVMVGEKKLLGEVISLDGDTGTIQVYEETEGLKSGENVYSTGNPLSLTLGPGMIGNVFDGIQRPLEAIEKNIRWVYSRRNRTFIFGQGKALGCNYSSIRR